MLDQLMNGFNDKNEALQEKLRTITVTGTAGDGTISVTANAAMEVANISIDETKLDMSNKEELEDLLLVAVNRALSAANDAANNETQNMMKDLLPPGMGNLFG